MKNGVGTEPVIAFVARTNSLMVNHHAVNKKMDHMTDQTVNNSFFIICLFEENHQPSDCSLHTFSSNEGLSFGTFVCDRRGIIYAC